MQRSPASRSPTPTNSSQVLLCVSCDSPAKSTDSSSSRSAAGGKADPGPKQDMGGMMYGRSFEDPDGHHWEPMWMDPQMAEQGAHPVESATADTD